ncbi:12980_t:CDS:2 [Gigaspora margarita]|uniref:12980_t:CDS:1 n=1 Tax=Gigaspora margarita TaxID=4874 RepID=A0ABM8VWS3_GIGMA|nr:12980_t:CDS:2 [Gigaspora margarita]
MEAKKKTTKITKDKNNENKRAVQQKIDRKLSRLQDLLKQEGNVLKRNKCIATWLGLHNLGLVTIIRKANEVYRNIAYKQSAKKSLSQEELNFIKFRDKIESSAVKVTHVTGDNQEKNIQKKKLLVDNEYGTMDYGLEETLLSETTKETTTIHKETKLHQVRKKMQLQQK